MPSYLDFNSTKKLRDLLIAKTIKRPNGPQTFTENNYTLKNVSDFSNIDLPNVDADRKERLLIPQKTNIFKPLEYLVKEEFELLPRRANLSLYWNGSPYFTAENHNLISIYNKESYETESELFKLSAAYIKSDPQGPIQARIKQNLEAATIGRFRLIDALNGNTATAINIITGREPLIEPNYKITVAKTALGKGVDFLQTVSGVEFPFSEIPGDYLTNPRNPIKQRPEARNQFGAIIQDVTGALGSLIGIRRRPKAERKPSDLMIEYLGDGQKNILFDLLSYSTYAPNYTTTARSQNSSKLFNVVDQFSQGVKNILGNEAPRGIAYIGDDRGEDVKNAMNDFNDRPVRSSYYLSLLFDPIQSQVFENTKNVSDGGELTGKLTWISRNSKNRLGARNDEWGSQSTVVNDSLSTNFSFRSDSILGITQEILDTMPTDGGAARSHVANVIDQTSRIFREGTRLLSRGSAVKYVDEYGGETGAEFCRVWTKDRAYFNYSDTMKRTGLIRKYDDSVLSTPWNLNIAPMSNGNRDFSSSTNIIDNQAKKYMFSIENLVWKTSNTPGFMYNDLPICERGPNGGRIMWFPPYDLTIGEQNNAKWETNSFIGRPEPIYTYQYTTRSGQVSFRVVVDHPSIINLLVKETFKNMSDEEADNYINAVFAGCQNIDFYDLVNRYPSIEPSDAELLIEYLNEGLSDDKVEDSALNNEGLIEEQNGQGVGETKKISATLLFANDFPKKTTDETNSVNDYSSSYSLTIGQTSYQNTAILNLDSVLSDILNLNTSATKKDRKRLAGKENLTNDEKTKLIDEQKNRLTDLFTKTTTEFDKYISDLNNLKSDIQDGNVKDITILISSSTSQIADTEYNKNLSLRRSHSVIKDIIKIISLTPPSEDKWLNKTSLDRNGNRVTHDISYSLKELGYTDKEGNVFFKTINYGEKAKQDSESCEEQKFAYEKNVPGGSSISLNITAPISFGCRKANVDIEYSYLANNNKNKTTLLDKDNINTDSPLKLPDFENINKPLTASKKKLIDPIKKIITKTLSECYYFQKLEESDPVVFTSLKEKLKYFHPSFHSTTPEGLNARLTFLQQCIRPGDTIPIKGKSQEEQQDARNTSFGPPPICILRIGDFYNTKVVINDLNITFEENTWDLNPEGIGVQPMIAKVTLQINFIGGQGLREPVNRLQNALSSNFYANTEIYDERSINTAKNIGFKKAQYSRKLLESIQKNDTLLREEEKLEDGNTTINGKFIGELSNNQLDYTNLIKNLYTSTENYFKTYETFYSKIIGEFGQDISSMILHPTYREINEFDVYESTSSTSTINFIGEYKIGNDLSKLVSLFKNEMIRNFELIDICEFLEIDKIIKPTAQSKTNRLLKPILYDILVTQIDKMGEPIDGELIKNRNSILSTLDKLNFVVKNELDGKLNNSESFKAELSGFTSNMLFNEYENLIDVIDTNTQKMYEDLDPNYINFYNPIITQSQFESIFLFFLRDKQLEVLAPLKNDTTLYDENTIKKIEKKLEKLLKTDIKVKNFNFKKAKRKKEVAIAYSVTESPLTDSAIIDELKLINSTKVRKPINNKLNNFAV